ncbi:hypothetical protein D3C87_1110930 [compost metagenome]
MGVPMKLTPCTRGFSIRPPIPSRVARVVKMALTKISTMGTRIGSNDRVRLGRLLPSFSLMYCS